MTDFNAIDAYWRAANYLTVGQIYLQDNPLLQLPLQPQHIKPRLLGHWGTSPGISLLYVHINRVIVSRNINVLFLAGPGHGGPAILANIYLEGVYSEVYPQISENTSGMHQFFRQFSTPGGVPSHVGPTTPGSIHEGGELGYVLSHAFGAAFDNPDLLVLAVVGDGEAETSPLEGSWKGISFLNPVNDGAVLPVLHLNGYKIAGPTVLGRADDKRIRELFSGHGYEPHFVEGSEPFSVHKQLADTLDVCLDAIKEIQAKARASGRIIEKPRWPMIILRTPKGWTGPKEVDGIPVEGTFRSHQVPLAHVRSNPTHLAMLEAWMKSYRPEELFDAEGKLIANIAALAPKGTRRMSANPHTTTGNLPLILRDYTQYQVVVPHPGVEHHESTRQLGLMLRDMYTDNPNHFRLFCPDETNSNRLGALFDEQNRCFVGNLIPTDDHVSSDGRVMEVLSEHNCEGWLEGYILTGRHGLFATYEAFALIVASMTTQHAKWLEMCNSLAWRTAIPSLNILLTSTCWRNDHNGFSHQGPGFMDTLISKKGYVVRVYLPPDANCLLSVSNHCFSSQNYVNIIIIDKQPQLQWLDMQAAREHCTRGASIWNWAGNGAKDNPDIILGCAGDTATLEILAAAAWLREKMPEFSVRVVNVVNLMTLASPAKHPHGMHHDQFYELFTDTVPVIFAFHGYAGAVHQLLHGRQNPGRFHVRGYNEEGTTTTPFDMVVMNKMSRFHLVIEALKRTPNSPENSYILIDECNNLLQQHSEYVHTYYEDMPQFRDWTFPY